MTKTNRIFPANQISYVMNWAVVRSETFAQVEASRGCEPPEIRAGFIVCWNWEGRLSAAQVSFRLAPPNDFFV